MRVCFGPAPASRRCSGRGGPMVLCSSRWRLHYRHVRVGMGAPAGRSDPGRARPDTRGRVGGAIACGSRSSRPQPTDSVPCRLVRGWLWSAISPTRERFWCPRRASLPAQPDGGRRLRDAARPSGDAQGSLVLGRTRRDRWTAALPDAHRTPGAGRGSIPSFSHDLSPDRPGARASATFRAVAGRRASQSSTSRKNNWQPPSNVATALSPRTASSPRVYLRQLGLERLRHVSLAAAFLASPAAGWYHKLAEHEPLSGVRTAWLAWLRNGFLKLALLFEPHTALLVQTEPGAGLADALDAAAVVVVSVEL